MSGALPRARLIVVTGGPGAGKTALLELVRRRYGERVVILPEAASIVFGGGFPRRPEPAWRRASQRTIFHVQRQLERGSIESNHVPIVFCDRGTLDGLAYWPDGDDGLLSDVGSTREHELARYDAIIHLRTPPASGFNHQNPLRTETAAQAEAIDVRIEQAWTGHPTRHVVPSTSDFLDKAQRALALIAELLPPIV